MPLVTLLKGTDCYYLAADNLYFKESNLIERTHQRQFRIQKFKNFVVGYLGSVIEFQRFVKEFDLDSFPEPLTKSFLIRHFYKDFLKFLAENTNAEIKDGVLIDSDFDLYIMGKDYAFDISDESLYEITELNASGDDAIAFYLYSVFKNKMSSEELVKTIYSESCKNYFSLRYPYILVKSNDLSTCHICYENREELITLEENWSKK